MRRLSLHVSDSTAAELRERAEREGLSVSRFLARLVEREIGEDWPDGYFDTVIGGWKGEPLERPTLP